MALPTIDKTITNEWTKIAEDTESFILSTRHNDIICIAYTTTDSAPSSSLQGHVLDSPELKAQGYARTSDTPPGFAFARTFEGTKKVGLTTWIE